MYHKKKNVIKKERTKKAPVSTTLSAEWSQCLFRTPGSWSHFQLGLVTQACNLSGSYKMVGGWIGPEGWASMGLYTGLPIPSREQGHGLWAKARSSFPLKRRALR